MQKPVLLKRIKAAFLWVFWVVVVQLIFINISAAFYAYRFSKVNDDPAAGTDNFERNIFAKTWRFFSGPLMPRNRIMEKPAFPYDTISLKTKQGLLIDAWYSQPDSVAKGTVLLFHGTRENKGKLIAEAAEFRYQGFNILMVDFRACGNSEGYVTTIGYREAEEVKLAFDFIKQKGEKKIYCWGNSMGAVAITRAIYEYQINPAGIILEMPFLSLKTHLRARLRSYKFRSFLQKPFAFLITAWVGIERGFNGFSHETGKYAESIHCPVLMQWGKKDEYVEFYETDGIFKALPGPQKKLVIYPQAGHESLLNNDPVQWRREVEQFLGNISH